MLTLMVSEMESERVLSLHAIVVEMDTLGNGLG